MAQNLKKKPKELMQEEKNIERRKKLHYKLRSYFKGQKLSHENKTGQ